MAVSVSATSLGIKSAPGGKVDTSSLKAVGTSKVRVGDQVIDRKTGIRQIRTLKGMQRLSSRGAGTPSAVLNAEMSTLSVMSAIGVSVEPVKDANYQLISEVTEPELIANPYILDSPVVHARGSKDALKSIDKSFPDKDDPIMQPDSTTISSTSVAATAAKRIEIGKKSSKLVADLCMINLNPAYDSTTKYFKEPETTSTLSSYKRRSKTVVLEPSSTPPKSRKRRKSSTSKGSTVRVPTTSATRKSMGHSLTTTKATKSRK